MKENNTSLKILDFLFALGVIGSIFQLVLLFLMDGTSMIEYVFMFLIVGFVCISGYGIFNRSRWGSICGAIVCVISLINIPFGTIIGLVMLCIIISQWKVFGKVEV